MLLQAGHAKPAPLLRDLLGTDTAALRAARPLLLRGSLPAAQTATCVAQGPMDDDGTVRRIALGTATGAVQVIDLQHACVAAQFAVHTAALLDVAWVGRNRLVALCRCGGNGNVHNEQVGECNGLEVYTAWSSEMEDNGACGLLAKVGK